MHSGTRCRSSTSSIQASRRPRTSVAGVPSCWYTRYAPLRFARAARIAPPPFEIPPALDGRPLLPRRRHRRPPGSRLRSREGRAYPSKPSSPQLSDLRAIERRGEFLLPALRVPAGTSSRAADGDLDPLEERARNATPSRWIQADPQTTYPQDWSHERFMRLVESMRYDGCAAPDFPAASVGVSRP